MISAIKWDFKMPKGNKGFASIENFRSKLIYTLFQKYF